jgi:hypothetical protein
VLLNRLLFAVCCSLCYIAHMSEETMCACGRPLHYNDSQLQRLVEEIAEREGETIRVTIGCRSWMVQRHYIALHGLKAWEVDEVAQKLGFAEVTEK